MDDLRIVPSLPDAFPDGAGTPSTRRDSQPGRDPARPRARALQTDGAPTLRRKPRPGRAIVTVPPRACGTIWFDYTDLVHYFADNRVPTGIQRVQIGLFRATLQREAGPTAERFGACSFDPQRCSWVALHETLLAAVCSAACHSANGSGTQGEEGEAWRGLVATMHQSVATGSPAAFVPGDVLVNIGSSWWIPDYLRFVRHLQRERGVLFASFVHDCIPLRVPETCSANLVAEFKDWFATAMQTADYVLANSEHTARDIAELASGVCCRTTVPSVIRLDARFDDGPQPSTIAAARLDATTHAALGVRRPFVLFVSTLEARKNHQFIFRCWQALIRRHGDAIPDLLCIGKDGWLFEYTRNWLQVQPDLRERIRLLGTVSDSDMAALYRTAQFTVYCSHYEGWGLPITESLCFGRVPIVPRHTSLPEAGQSFALYYEPDSAEQFCAHVETLLDRKHLVELEHRIRARYRPRTWSDVLTTIAATLRRAPAAAHRAEAAPEYAMRPGRLYTLGRARPETDDKARLLAGDHFRYGIGWHAAEDWGCWSRLPQAQLLMVVPRRARDASLYVCVKAGPGGCPSLQMHVDGNTVGPFALQPGERKLLRIRLDPSLSGREACVTLAAPTYALRDFTGGQDGRAIGFGAEWLSIVGQQDVAGRIDVLDHFLALG